MSSFHSIPRTDAAGKRGRAERVRTASAAAAVAGGGSALRRAHTNKWSCRRLRRRGYVVTYYIYIYIVLFII